MTDRMDPLQKLMAALSKSGQELVGSAAPGVDTANLEKEMEEANDKWTALQQKVSWNGYLLLVSFKGIQRPSKDLM